MNKNNLQKIAEEIFQAPTKEDLADRYAVSHGWKRNPDGTFDVFESVYANTLSSVVEKGKFKIKFNVAHKGFECSGTDLVSLEGTPRRIEGSFYCDRNQLINLKGGPDYVAKHFDCSGNALISLEGAPQTSRIFDCSENNLTSLDGCPKEATHFDCSGNMKVFTEDEVKARCKVSGSIVTRYKGRKDFI